MDKNYALRQVNDKRCTDNGAYGAKRGPKRRANALPHQEPFSGAVFEPKRIAYGTMSRVEVVL